MLVFVRSLRALAVATVFATTCLATPSLGGDQAPAATPDATAKSAVTKVVSVETLAFTAQMVGDKKTWVPTKVTAKAGQTYNIVLVNQLAEPHGFKVENLVQPLIVEANKTQTVTVTMPKEKKKLPFTCQLHPAHVGGEIVVE